MDVSGFSSRKVKGLSFINYLRAELRRGYLLENDEERYAARREKVYTFFKIPREIEKFLAYGFFQSADSFLFVLTFLPIRFVLASWCLITRPLKQLFGLGRNMTRLMKPAEIVDLLKGALLIICCYAISYIDTSVWYHIIKTQSTIKLYLFFNMLEIADRLMSAFGQDTLDALFWTATEPRDRKREHFGILFHLVVSSIYVVIHSGIVLLQALSLNVAINSDNKGLLTILISNNFVELKGAVFKKFDRNNLLQISCSDVRERFHICILLFIVVIQTMKEYSWKEERLWILLPDCLLVLGTEILIDWVKHAFIIRFNDIPIDSYRDFTLLIASDLIICKQKYAYSDHSDLVARRMGFIPLPLGVVIFRILSQSLSLSNAVAFVLFVIGFLCLLTFRVLNGVIILGKACDLINTAELQRSRNASEALDKSKAMDYNKTPSSKSSGSTNVTPFRQRRRTKSREGRLSVGDKIENLQLKFSEISVENIGSPIVPPKILDKLNTSLDDEMTQGYSNQGTVSPPNDSSRRPKRSSSSSPALSSGLCNQEGFLDSSGSSLPPSTDEKPVLGFLGESQFGLMANSMVNLASVGLNQGITDHNCSATITQAISPDIVSKDGGSSLIERENMFDFHDVTVVGLSTSFSEDNDLVICQDTPLSSAKSCPSIQSSYSIPERLLEPPKILNCSKKEYLTCLNQSSQFMYSSGASNIDKQASHKDNLVINSTFDVEIPDKFFSNVKPKED